MAPTTPPTRGFDTEELTHDTTPGDVDTETKKEEDKKEEVKEKIVVLTKDIGGIKKAARRSYELYYKHNQASLSLDSNQSKAARSKVLADANLKRYNDRKRELLALGYDTLVRPVLLALGYDTLVRPGQPDKLDFEEIKDDGL